MKTINEKFIRLLENRVSGSLQAIQAWQNMVTGKNPDELWKAEERFTELVENRVEHRISKGLLELVNKPSTTYDFLHSLILSNIFRLCQESIHRDFLSVEKANHERLIWLRIKESLEYSVLPS